MQKQAAAVLIVAIVVAIREIYIRDGSDYYIAGLLLLLIPVLNISRRVRRMRTRPKKGSRAQRLSEIP
jgi:hypothetical protein